MKKGNPEKIEEYVPINMSNIKKTVEVQYKRPSTEDLITIEKKGKMPKKKIKATKLKNRKIQEESEEDVRPIIKGDYTLIVTEKPQAALKIASSLGNPKKLAEKGAPYYIIERDKKRIIVACAAGHLFGLTTKEKGFPIFNISWEPSYKKNPWSKRFYSALLKLAKNASEFIVATDYDIEGEVIGWNIIRFIGKQKDAKRMKFSTLTKDELVHAYENMHPTLDWGLAIAGETRHFLDWMYGINLSRALMDAIKKAGTFKIMSIGRVQGPALNLIVKKELEIQKFVPEKYFQIFVKLFGHEIELRYEKDIKKESELEPFKHLNNKTGIATTEKHSKNLNPPTPFDLTSLQREAYRLFKLNPSRTLQIAQQLYLSGYISYPRTSSQKIPEAINPKEIINRLSKVFKEASYATRDTPIEGKKSDPAHPSIYPTGEYAKLANEEENIYLLVVKRFLACFAEDAVIENKKIIFEVENKKFLASGLSIEKEGWMKIYPATFSENIIEDITGEKKVEKSRIEEKMTQPPHRYTPASIITELEKRNLGTKATRANIVETLYNRNYVKSQSLEATPLGIKLIASLEKYSPVIIDEKLTRELEGEMNSIQNAKKGFYELQEKTVSKAKTVIEKISQDFRKNEKEIGSELLDAKKENYEKEREENTVGLCQNCKKGSLRIMYNKKFRRYFIGCSAYPECKTTYSLPPYGLMKPTGKICEECGFPLVMAISKGKRPWEFCFNIRNHKDFKGFKKKEE